MKNRVAIAIELLEKHGYVTNAMFQEVGLTHTGRNAVGESKPYFLQRGFTIQTKLSRDFLQNRWTLVPVRPMEIKVEASGQTAFL